MWMKKGLISVWQEDSEETHYKGRLGIFLVSRDIVFTRFVTRILLKNSDKFISYPADN